MATRRLLPLLLCLAAWSGRAHAVDPTGIKIGDRWSVVGIIAGDSGAGETGIAVIRNNASKRTYTLTIGDAVPTEFGFVLKSVKNKTVVIGDQRESVILSFAEPGIDEAETVSQTRRFIDNYYRSLGDGAEGDARLGDGEEPARLRDETGYVPLTRFGDSREVSRSRFELYREERGDVEAEAGGLDAEGTTAGTYENFEAAEERAASRAEELEAEVEEVSE